MMGRYPRKLPPLPVQWPKLAPLLMDGKLGVNVFPRLRGIRLFPTCRDTFLAYLRQNVKDLKNCCLVVDLFSAHRDERVLSLLRGSGVDVIYVPGGCTGILQVMDVVVNSHFKRHIKNGYQSWRAVQIQGGEVFAKPSRPLLIKWVMDAWDAFPVATLQQGMEKYIVHPATQNGPLIPIPTHVELPGPMSPEDLVTEAFQLLCIGSVGRQ